MSRSSKKTKYGAGVTTYNEKGDPRTKGMHNAFIEAAHAPKGGFIPDKRSKRSKDAKHSWQRDQER